MSLSRSGLFASFVFGLAIALLVMMVLSQSVPH